MCTIVDAYSICIHVEQVTIAKLGMTCLLYTTRIYM